MTRLIAAVAREIPASCRAAQVPAVVGFGLLAGLALLWFTPLAGWLQ